MSVIATIAIFNLGDRFLAVDNRCPHKGGPVGRWHRLGSDSRLPAARVENKPRNRQRREQRERVELR